MILPDICPCGSSNKFENCCGLYIYKSKPAPDPEALMRSRYTAFCLNELQYLQKTWHPETFPADLALDEPAKWIGLEIISASEEIDDEAEVEFRAKSIFDNRLELLHEISLFYKVDGLWLYHSGEFEGDNACITKISKNEVCPCGSAKKFKNCHFEP